MQNKKTVPVELVDKLPELSEQEMKFVEGLCAGKSQAEAYREAYGAEGYSDASLRVRACQKAATKKIRAHMRAYQAIGISHNLAARDNWIEMVLASAQRAENDGNHGAAMTGRVAVGKALGHMVDKVEDVTHGSALSTLREIAKASPELAKQLADQHGIPWDELHADATKH